MTLQLGEIIKSLRKRDGRTQDALAEALGISAQAVSRWETNMAYPDMELIPSIANYFNVSIDELFGYDSERDKKVDEIIRKVDAYEIKSRGDDGWVDECIVILREGLAEFPQNEKLLMSLADTLSEAGWRRHNEWLYYDEEGYMQHNYDQHRTNEYWMEAVKVCEKLVSTSHDQGIVARSISILVLLYRNFGENAKAIAYAKRMPSLKYSQEILLAAATDGKEEAQYISEALLKLASKFAEQLVYGLVNNVNNYETDMPIEKINGAIAVFYLVCDDEKLGNYHGDLIKLHLYLSRVQWERGYHEEAFESLNEALRHARTLEKHLSGKKIAKDLPGDWPFWCNPDYSQVEKDMKADPRWAEWVEKTQG